MKMYSSCACDYSHQSSLSLQESRQKEMTIRQRQDSRTMLHTVKQTMPSDSCVCSAETCNRKESGKKWCNAWLHFTEKDDDACLSVKWSSKGGHTISAENIFLPLYFFYSHDLSGTKIHVYISWPVTSAAVVLILCLKDVQHNDREEQRWILLRLLHSEV